MKIDKLMVQPRYYKSFQCIGGACIQSCCRNWGLIQWTTDEYEKLVSAEMSEELRSRITGSFVKTENARNPGKTVYNLKENDRQCPIQDPEGLCMIQRELGEEYLSITCRMYPRVMIEGEKYFYRVCHSSCYGVVKTLFSDETAMELDISKYSMSKSAPKSIAFFAEEDQIQKRPILRYFNEILRFFYDIVSDKSYPLETALVLGALAAQQFTKLEENHEYDRVPEAIATLRNQLQDKEQIEKIGNIQPNDNYRIALPYEIITKETKRAVTVLGKSLEIQDNVVSVEKYKEGRRRLAELFKGREFYRRNLALNMLLETWTPFREERLTIYENWLYLCASFSEIEFLMTAAVFHKQNPEYSVECTASAMGRSFAHTLNISFLTVDYLRRKGFTKPAHIALMLKDPQ